jgi:hypothetical protein
MSEDQNRNSGATGEEGGASSTQADDSSASSDNGKTSGSPKAVSWDNHKRALDDLHKYKNQVKDLETRLGDLESNSLKEKQDFKTLYEQEKQKRSEAEKREKSWKDWSVQTQRYNEVKSLAMQKGLIPQSLPDLELLDLSEVAVEVTSGNRFLVEGADVYVERLQQSRPHWFKSTKAPTVNGGGGGSPPPPESSKLTSKDVFDAERKWKTKQITREKYEEIYGKFVAQRNKA